MRLPHTGVIQLYSYDDFDKNNIAISPRELFSMIFYPREFDKGLRYFKFLKEIDDIEWDYSQLQSFFEMRFDLLASKYNGVVFGDFEGPDGGFGFSDSDMFINTHLYKPFSLGIATSQSLERNLDYAPFFLCYWQDRPMIGYVWENNDKQVYNVGYLDDNRWFNKRPNDTLAQNDGQGWYSDRLILFPMYPAYSVLNYPEGI